MRSRPIRKLLVANRGEIALRVARAARELGIATVAVYADQDRDALHVRAAGESLPLEGKLPGETYLDIPKLLAAARRSGADAVHPGYGFLAESPAFARAVEEAGLTFVGPPTAALRLSGHKLEARALVRQAGVPVIPTHQGPPASFAGAAGRLGYPLLVKAAAGGGGRGIRRVESAARLEEMARAASREAASFFADGEVYLEQEIAAARHVEVQILADLAGGVAHLFERECSIQRRHQKLIEETPSPALDLRLREEITRAAVSAAKALGYRNAGTVEFLLELDGEEKPRGFYFLELNARIQVEHPITEAVTGEDLVAWQLRIAAGEPLAPRLEGIEPRGHAIECRLCAETPPSFLPSAGTLRRFRPPRGPGIRFDEGYAEGDAVPAEFDSLIGKAVAWGRDRPEALARMAAALEASEVLGVDTNLDHLIDILRHPAFQAGRYTTRFIEREMAGWTAPAAPPEVEAIARAALARRMAPRGGAAAEAPRGPWELLDGWEPAGRRG
jgi:acetyl/propionyl-CoA carboxylase alpha subunit